MSQVLEVIPEAPAETLVIIDIEISVDDNDKITCSNLYATVPENHGADIRWTLIAPPNVFFDTPAITMFGENANVAWHPIVPGSNVRSATWYNDEEHAGRSYEYRIHLVKKVGTQFLPLVLDPIVHNEPPPAP